MQFVMMPMPSITLCTIASYCLFHSHAHVVSCLLDDVNWSITTSINRWMKLKENMSGSNLTVLYKENYFIYFLFKLTNRTWKKREKCFTWAMIWTSDKSYSFFILRVYAPIGKIIKWSNENKEKQQWKQILGSD